jgi:integrase
MDEDQLATFLAVARIQQPEHFYRFAVLAYAGLRSGECRGLQAQDIDFDRKRIHVERQVYLYGGSGLPKGSKTRDVELGDALAGILAECIAARREFDMRTGRRSPWLLFPEFAPEPTRAEAGAATARVAVAMKACLMAAGLPEHFTPHCLRHTFATVQLSRGESLLYVARQLGDTLQITAETYGAWARVPSTAGGPNLLTSGRDRLGRQEG